MLEDRLTPSAVGPEAAISVANYTSATSLVAELLGPGASFTNASLIAHSGTGTTKDSDSASAGTFSGGASILGIASGIVLSTGGVQNVVGPNDGDGYSQSNGLDGDSQLSVLAKGTATHDATVLSFDFIPAKGTVSFQYVFSSEEYNEFVGQGFNDLFALFVNGQNVAHLPGSTTVISVNSINLGVNSQYFLNNDPVDGGPNHLNLNTEMDGLTTVLTITATVTPGSVNHVKLAIADVNDDLYDSNVFIRATDFSTYTAPDVTAPSDQSAFENVAQSFNLGAFTAQYGGPWQVTVNWGDNTPNTTFAANSVGALSSQIHVFSGLGSKTVTVTVSNDAHQSDSATFHVGVADPAVIVEGGYIVDATVLTPSALQTVATFTDPGGAQTVNDYLATIDWGDGSEASTGVITISQSEGASVFVVKGSHTYLHTGSYVIATTIAHGEALAASANSEANVGKATPVVEINANGGPYNGSPYPATANVAGVDGIPHGSLEGVIPTLTYYVGLGIDGEALSGAPGTPGTYTVVASFAGSENYGNASAQASFTIVKAAPSLDLTANGGPFNGAAYPASVTISGVDGVPQAALDGIMPTLTYYVGLGVEGAVLPGAPVKLGSYTVVASFAGSENYASASAQASFTITVAPPTVGAVDGHMTSTKMFAPGETGEMFGPDDWMDAEIVERGTGTDPMIVSLIHFESNPMLGSDPDVSMVSGHIVIQTDSGPVVEQVSYDFFIHGATTDMVVILRCRIPQAALDSGEPLRLYYINPTIDSAEYQLVPESMYVIEDGMFVITLSGSTRPSIFDLSGTVFTITDAPAVAPVVNTTVTTLTSVPTTSSANVDVLGSLLSTQPSSQGGQFISVIAPSQVTLISVNGGGGTQEQDKDDEKKRAQEWLKVIESFMRELQRLLQPQIQSFTQGLIVSAHTPIAPATPPVEAALAEMCIPENELVVCSRHDADMGALPGISALLNMDAADNDAARLRLQEDLGMWTNLLDRPLLPCVALAAMPMLPWMSENVAGDSRERKRHMLGRK